MPCTCLNVFNSRDANEPASVAPGYYAYPFDNYDRAAVGPFATPALAICAARAVEARTSQPFTVTTDSDDDLVFVEFAPAAEVAGHGFPDEVGPQHDAHADAWLDALDLMQPSGYRPALTVDDQIRRLDDMLRDYHAEKRARSVPSLSCEQALADIVAALPPAATTPAPVAGSRVI